MSSTLLRSFSLKRYSMGETAQERRERIRKEQGERLAKARRAAGYETREQAAESIRGLNVQLLYQRETGRRGLNPQNADDYAKYFHVNANWLLTGDNPDGSNTLPVVGYVGAGAEVFLVDDHAKGAGIDEIEAPPGCPKGALAVRVRGDSMYPAFRDGDVLIYAERFDDATEMLQRECVVWLADGTVYVKTLTPGTRPNRFTLISYNAPPLIDRHVIGAAPILWIRRT